MTYCPTCAKREVSGRMGTEKIPLMSLVPFEEPLKNLWSVVPPGGFESCYEPHPQAMKSDPVMRFFS